MLLNRLKNFIAEKGNYHTPAIAISGFTELGEPVKRFEYFQIEGIQTYSPELEEIEGRIRSIESWGPKYYFK